MLFNFFHVVVFLIALISGLIGITRVRLMSEPENLKKYSLEKIFGLAIFSFFWIIFGAYKDVGSVSLHFEVFIFCFLLLSFLLKLNSSESNKFFGKLVPGHGREESKLAKRIKYIIVYTIGIFILLLTIFILLDVNGLL